MSVAQHRKDMAKAVPAFATALRGILDDQKAAGKVNRKADTAALKAAVLPAVTTAVGIGATRPAKAAGVEAGDPDTDLAGALSYKFASQFTNTTADQLDAQDDDDDPDDIFDARSGLSDAIAGTVISGAINAGAQIFASALDPAVQPQKSWAVEDGNPCADCDIDGETADADADFSNGAPHGPIHPGCECTVDWQPPAESRSRRAEPMNYAEWRADKYSDDDMKDLLDKGKAMKNANGDPSYPVADREDIEKAVKAVGRGSADHDAIRAHIIKGAKAIDASDLIPDNWNADGSLADAESKSRKHAPNTREARADESMSFGNIQSLVYAAVVAALPFGKGDIWISDCGPDWVVWHNYDQGGDFKVGYALDPETSEVTFTGPVTEVAESVTYVPVASGQTLSGETAGETRTDADTCSRCKGDKTVTLNGNDVECPQCGGTGTGENNATAQTNSSRRPNRRRSRRDLPRHGERRLYTAKIEMRGKVEGDEVVLTGMPIRFDAPYQVRDMFGAFRETMRSGVADKVLANQELDCRFLENHTGRPMARTVNGTLTLTQTAEGVPCEARVDTRRTDCRDLSLAVERGDVTQMSCGFVVADDGEDWRMGDDGVEERDVFSFGELFDVSAVTYPASPTTSIELATRALAGVSEESRERIRRLWTIAKNLREGKMLSQQNGQELMEALEALHEADDVDIPGIVRSLQVIDHALDAGQAGISSVLGRANPDGDPADLEPALVPPPDAKRARQMAELTIIRTRELLAVS